MDKQNEPISKEQEQEQKRFKKFLDRLTIFHHDTRMPIRSWLAWLGVALFIALVIVYYAINGG